VTCSVAARWAGHCRCGGRRSSARAWRANSGLAGHSGSVMGSGSARASGTAGNWVRRGTGSGGEPGADAGVGCSGFGGRLREDNRRHLAGGREGRRARP
jgi:hypothetical protein